MNLKNQKKRSGQYATSEEELTKYKDTHPIINDILSLEPKKFYLPTSRLPALINPDTGQFILHLTNL